MLHLAVLIANPGTEITAFDLVSGMTAVRRAAGGGLSRQAILDRTAVAGYRRRLAQLRDAPADPGPADPEPGHRDERDWLSGELAANTRPGRPARAFGDEAERARVAAGRAIRRALAAVERADPVIGAHLRAAVHTGARCWYRPV